MNRWLTRLVIHSALPLAVVVAATGSAAADDLIWDGDTDFFYDTPDNWDLGQNPSGGDHVLFDASAASFLVVPGSDSLAGDVSVLGGSFTLQGGSGSLLTSTGDAVIDGGTLLATGANTAWGIGDDLTVGAFANGTLDVEAGAVVTHLGLFLGSDAFASGTMNVAGAGTQVGTRTVGSIQRIGVYGTGLLNISSAAIVNGSSALVGQFAGSHGTVNVDGAGTQWINNGYDLRVGDTGAVGNVATGFLNVTGGATAMTTGSGDFIVGFGPDSVGTAVVDTGSTVSAGQYIFVGNEGAGTATIQGGSSLAATRTIDVGRLAAGTGMLTVDGAGSRLQAGSSLASDNNLFVGNSGHGIVTIRNSASLDVAYRAVVGVAAGNTNDNRLVVTGDGTTATFNERLHVGDEGRGYFELSAGATATTAGTSEFGRQSTGAGTVLVDGEGTVWNPHFLFVGNEGTATMTISGGAFVNHASATFFTVGDSGSGNGTLHVTGTDANGLPSRIQTDDQAEIGGSQNEDGGNGVVNVTAGGSVVSDGALVGVRAGAEGTINVSGKGSEWVFIADPTSDTMNIGVGGAGRLNVTAGGRVDVDALRAGDAVGTAAADLLISGSENGTPSTVNVQTNMVLGDDRAATLAVENGAVLNTGLDGGHHIASIGDNAGVPGTSVTVDNAVWNHSGTNRISVASLAGTASAPSRLDVTNGGIVSTHDLLVADGNNSYGAMSVGGAGSTVQASGFVVIGDQGPGSLTVSTGGRFEATELFDVGGISNGTGTLLVTGPDSAVVAADTLRFGRDGDARVTIENGGAVTGGASAYIALTSTSASTVNVQSGGVWSVGDSLFVGGSDIAAGGLGTLNLSSGGSTLVGGLLKIWPGGTVNLEGAATTLQLTDLERAAGGSFNFTSGILSLSNNVANNRVLDASALEGYLGAGPTLASGQTLLIAGPTTLAAPLRLNGGTLSVHSVKAGTEADFTANLDWDAGTLHFTGQDITIDDGELFGDTLIVAPGKGFIVNQTTTNNGAIHVVKASANFLGGLVNNADLVLSESAIGGPVNSPAGSTVTVLGTVTFRDLLSGGGDFFGPGTAVFAGGQAPGDSPARVSFEGSVEYAVSNSLEIELGGLVAGDEYDVLDIQGTALLDGELLVSLVDGFSPSQGNSFEFLSAAGGLSGQFATLSLPALAGGLAWSIDSTATAITLNVRAGATLEADFDLDGDVDGDDFLVWQSGFGSGMTHPEGDADRDGDVDGDDFLRWQSQFGSGAGSAASQPVPEPAAVGLIVLLFSAAACRRGRRFGLRHFVIRH